MRKNLPIILFLFPVIILVGILAWMYSVKGDDSTYSYSDMAILLGVACVASASIEFLGYRSAIRNFMKSEPTKQESKVFPRVFGYFTIGLLFSFYFLWNQIDNDTATKKCFHMYDDEASIKHCIETGENVPDYDAVSF